MSLTIEEFKGLEPDGQLEVLIGLLGEDVQVDEGADLVELFEQAVAENNAAGSASEGSAGAGSEGGAAGSEPEASQSAKPASAAKPSAKAQAGNVKKGFNKQPLVFLETVRFADGKNKFFVKKGDELEAGKISEKVAKALKDDGHAK